MSARRKQALFTQALQLLDAALVWLGFWLASLVREPIRELAGMTTSTGHLTLADMSWALYIVVPFTPLVLECFGFYRHARRRPRHETILPIAKALAVMGLVLGLISLLLHPRESSRLILGIGVPIVAFLLLLRDRATCRWVSLPEPP